MEKKPHSHAVPGNKLAWNDPTQVRQWLTALREDVFDALVAGEDATRPFNKRVLSRAEARRRILEAERNLEKLLEAAERSLPPAGEGT